MFGYTGFGRARFAAVDNTNPGGLIYTPVTVRVVYEPGPAPTVSGINPISARQIVRETLRSASVGGTEIRTFTLVRETLRSLDEGADTDDSDVYILW